MIFGFNTDVKFGNTVYHVQSEARKNERLLQSQIFVKGRCIGKRATSYVEKVDETGFSEEQLHELLKAQHRRFVEAVRAGRIEEELDLDPGSTASFTTTSLTAAVAPSTPTPVPPEPATTTTLPAASTTSLDALVAELKAPTQPSRAATPNDELAAGFAAAMAEKPAEPVLTLSPLSGMIGKGLFVECLPPSCAADNSAVVVGVQVTEEGGTPAAGAQLTCRISSGQGPASYAYATAGSSGIADLRIALAAKPAETSLMMQASYRGKSASRKYALRRSG